MADKTKTKTKTKVLKPSTVKMLCTRFFNDNDIPFIAKEVTQISENKYNVKFESQDPSKNGLYLKRIVNWGRIRGIWLHLECLNPLSDTIQIKGMRPYAVRGIDPRKIPAKKRKTSAVTKPDKGGVITKGTVSDIKGKDPRNIAYKPPTKTLVTYGSKKKKADTNKSQEEWDNWLSNTSLR